MLLYALQYEKCYVYFFFSLLFLAMDTLLFLPVFLCLVAQVLGSLSIPKMLMLIFLKIWVILFCSENRSGKISWRPRHCGKEEESERTSNLRTEKGYACHTHVHTHTHMHTHHNLGEIKSSFVLRVPVPILWATLASSSLPLKREQEARGNR